MPEDIPRRPGELRTSAEVARDVVGHFPAHNDTACTGCKLTGCKGKSSYKQSV